MGRPVRLGLGAEACVGEDDGVDLIDHGKEQDGRLVDVVVLHGAVLQVLGRSWIDLKIREINVKLSQNKFRTFTFLK